MGVLLLDALLLLIKQATAKVKNFAWKIVKQDVNKSCRPLKFKHKLVLQMDNESKQVWLKSGLWSTSSVSRNRHHKDSGCSVKPFLSRGMDKRNPASVCEKLANGNTKQLTRVSSGLRCK